MSRLARRLVSLVPTTPGAPLLTDSCRLAPLLIRPAVSVPLGGARRLLSTSMVCRAPTLEEAATLISAPDKLVEVKYGGVALDPTKAPVVLLFGWAGASFKNLGKYAKLYQKAGCFTAQFILPTRHIFRDTTEVPELMWLVWQKLEEAQLADRQLFIHCLSDTGVMCYQGLDIALARQGVTPNRGGVVWDSCPGPYPECNMARVMAFLIINWMCSLRDGLGMSRSLHSSYRLMVERVWPSYLRKWKGLPVELSKIEGQWCGHFGLEHAHSTPELFLYSKKDFYLPYKYLEDVVLASRKNREFKSVCFPTSPHVAHFRYFPKEYAKHVQTFVLSHVEGRGVPESAEKEDENTREFRTSFGY